MHARATRRKQKTAVHAGKTVVHAGSVDYRTLSEFRYALRKFLTFSKSAARKAGVSPQQHQALLSIKGSADGALSVQELSERLLVRHNSAVELVNRLVQGRLAVRNVDPSDRRRVKVSLTGKSERLLQRLSAAHVKELRTIRPALLDLLLQLDRPR